MSENRSPPPPAAACLLRPRPSTQKGGTLIHEDVKDREAHCRRLCDPDGYRPHECPTCCHDVMHVHQYRERVQRGDLDPVITIAVYLCAGCGATWRILPLFLARHLWRTWCVVEAATLALVTSPALPPVPARTVRRWAERLRSSARKLVQLLATSGNMLLEAAVHAVGVDAARGELVASYTATVRPVPRHPLADLAALVHRLGPGLRLV